MKTRWKILISLLCIWAFVWLNLLIKKPYDNLEKGYQEGACLADEEAGFTFGKINAETEYKDEVLWLIHQRDHAEKRYTDMMAALFGPLEGEQ